VGTGRSRAPASPSVDRRRDRVVAAAVPIVHGGIVDHIFGGIVTAAAAIKGIVAARTGMVAAAITALRGIIAAGAGGVIASSGARVTAVVRAASRVIVARLRLVTASLAGPLVPTRSSA
jgi:hypothetical protein